MHPVSDNACMADSTVYVAAITGAFTVLGASVPLATSVLQSKRQADSEERRFKDTQRERHRSEIRDACMALRRAVGDLRTQVANNYDYHGEEMAARLARVREHAQAAEIHAVHVSMRDEYLGGLAMRLGTAASQLAVKTAANTDVDGGVVTLPPDFTELDECIAAFVEKAKGTGQG